MTNLSSQAGVLLRDVTRRNPFQVTHVPPLARCYAWPMNRWRTSRGRQILFGAPHLLVYSLWRKLPPLGVVGRVCVQAQDGRHEVPFDARNSQYQALYLDEFQAGYEPEVAALLDVLLPEQGVFFDIGSNFGYFSVLAATRPGFRGQVHAFEPFANSFRDLRQLVEGAGLGALVTPHHLALSDRNGAARMNLPDHIHSGLATLDSVASGTPGAVTVSRLDELKLPAPDVIKIDAEGAEVAILRGAALTLQRAEPFVIFENMRNFAQPEETLAPLRLLRDAGHRFFQPVWRRALNGEDFLVPTDGNFHAAARETLALVPVTVEDRFLRQDQLNLLSVPPARLAELGQRFATFAPHPA